MVRRLEAHTTTTICQSAQLPTTRTAQPIFAWANVTFKQATVLKVFVASGTFLPSLFRERARVPSKANASKPRGPRRRRHLEAATLWVLRENAGARRFYERIGGEVVGEKEDIRDQRIFIEVAYGWRNLAELVERTVSSKVALRPIAADADVCSITRELLATADETIE
jgi:hypothetical protein